ANVDVDLSRVERRQALHLAQDLLEHHGLSRRDAARQRRSTARLGAEDLDARAENAAQSERRAADEAAASDGNDHDVDVGPILGDLLTDGAGAFERARRIVRMDERAAVRD